MEEFIEHYGDAILAVLVTGIMIGMFVGLVKVPVTDTIISFVERVF